MRFTRSKVSIAFSFVALAAIVTAFAVSGAFKGATSATNAHAASASSTHYTLNCASATQNENCAEVYDSSVFGYYVGHDEPSTLFYSNVPGSGNQMRYEMWLPSDPPPTPEVGRSYNFELHPAFWFGMAMCDTQSYPELLSNCTPDSDKNIADPAITPKHTGQAFMEMQFYPPGWVEWPAGDSCDATKWCAALNIDSFQENPVTGQFNNATCQSTVGVEPVNFAFITKSGKSQAPANPVQATLATYTPNPSKDLFMNSGDEIVITMHDTANGLKIVIDDQTTGQSGSMTASAANGFGQVKWDPTGSTCQNIPYDFHPMYSTSSEKTRVTWAAHSYNIAFSDEIGHFDFCTRVDTSNGTCTGKEGIWNDREPADSDDVGCFPASDSSLVPVSGCLGTNTGFDGVPYQPLWPDGKYNLHPTPIRFTSPMTGSNYDVQYSRMAFEADLPRIEFSTCDRNTGTGCTLIPETDDGVPATFYPFYSDTMTSDGCVWQLGNHIPGSMNDFHQNQQYGTLLNLTYTGPGGHPTTRYNDFRQILSTNPCPAEKE
jgi:hypothetical protein